MKGEQGKRIGIAACTSLTATNSANTAAEVAAVIATACTVHDAYMHTCKQAWMHAYMHILLHKHSTTAFVTTAAAVASLTTIAAAPASLTTIAATATTALSQFGSINVSLSHKHSVFGVSFNALQSLLSSVLTCELHTWETAMTGRKIWRNQ